MMIEDSVLGAIYLSVIDMILLCVFLTVVGWIIRLLPVVNRFNKEYKGRRTTHDNH